MQIYTEEYYDSMGSCCDSGRFVFSNCENFWYYCPNWGLRNYSACWIRHGHDGLTFPCGSVHQARCEFFKEKIECPKPENCESMFLTGSADTYCSELSIIEKTHV